MVYHSLLVDLSLFVDLSLVDRNLFVDLSLLVDLILVDRGLLVCLSVFDLSSTVQHEACTR